MKYLSSLALFFMALVGCSTTKVQVQDISGKPIAGAEIFSLSLSITQGPTHTNAKGMATPAKNSQGIKWLRVEKPGYQTVTVEVTGNWPLIIVLEQESNH